MPDMFRRISDFATAWDYESDATLRMLQGLTDESLEERITPETRTAGGLAWHIACSIGEMMTLAGLPLGHLPAESGGRPESSEAIANSYDEAAKALQAAAIADWTDDQLEDDLPMYGESWKKGFVLSLLLNHQAHHRGQLTMLMRKAGLKVPGVYGPSREEWPAGMAAPD